MRSSPEGRWCQGRVSRTVDTQYVHHGQSIDITYGGSTRSFKLRAKGEGKQGVLSVDIDTTLSYAHRTARAEPTSVASVSRSRCCDTEHAD